MKQILVFLAVFGATKAVLFHPDFQGRGLRSQYKIRNDLGHYNFAYNEDHEIGGIFRREFSDGNGNAIGFYGLRDVDGRVRVENYVADDDGFRDILKSNERGVKASNPSAVKINHPDPLIQWDPMRDPIRSLVPTSLLHASVPIYAPTYQHRVPVKFNEYYY